MKKLFLYLSLLSVIIILLLKSMYYWPESKLKHFAFVFTYSDQFIEAMSATEDAGYVSIQWYEKSQQRDESSMAWEAGEPKYKKVIKPDLSKIIGPYKKTGLHSLWLQNYQGAWLIRKAFSYKGENGMGEGIYAFGTVNPKDVCLPNTQCVEHLFGQWHVIKN
ncbi:hypothetical protein L1285_17205 [Pseudoalteromonas sp. DL2-H2.2]|uniref:hypothetical protein n=1 Tax=Pseudoalteromonas sp. DL2-H2.2 TaxID=2908889 RepID=UPI001F4335F6|nr:hypothetical protein [Pseudoalteromonas sp. DL2-H2.2]MCF2910054.1 hypothetical protein [Pseudoalteromonas sp. DL2-H2.2]